MKRHAFLLVAVATALLATSCSAQSSTSPATGSSSVSPSAAATQDSSMELSTPSPVASGSSTASAPDTQIPDSPIASNVKGKPGIATDEQMVLINRVARDIANEQYDDAAAAGYYVFDNHGGLVQDATQMASLRAKHAESFDTAKAAYAKGDCQLVPVSINSSGVIYSNMICDDGSTPNVVIHAAFASWMNGQFYYIDALYAR